MAHLPQNDAHVVLKILPQELQVVQLRGSEQVPPKEGVLSVVVVALLDARLDFVVIVRRDDERGLHKHVLGAQGLQSSGHTSVGQSP